MEEGGKPKVQYGVEFTFDADARVAITLYCQAFEEFSNGMAVYEIIFKMKLFGALCRKVFFNKTGQKHFLHIQTCEAKLQLYRIDEKHCATETETERCKPESTKTRIDAV